MNQAMRELLANNEGATLVEYALLLTLIAVIAIIAIEVFGQNTSTVLNSAATSI